MHFGQRIVRARFLFTITMTIILLHYNANHVWKLRIDVCDTCYVRKYDRRFARWIVQPSKFREIHVLIAR